MVKLYKLATKLQKNQPIFLQRLSANLFIALPENWAREGSGGGERERGKPLIVISSESLKPKKFVISRLCSHLSFFDKLATADSSAREKI